MVSQADIDRCGRMLVDASSSPARVIVFGSYARGTAGESSDLDFLVIEEEVASRAAESARLRDVLPRLAVPVDVIVLSEEQASRRAQVRGSAVATALAEGVSSPSPEFEFARSLARKAREDLDALVVLHERGGIADSVLGFHAQQSVEKALKAAIVVSGGELRRTHDLRFWSSRHKTTASSCVIRLPRPRG